MSLKTASNIIARTLSLQHNFSRVKLVKLISSEFPMWLPYFTNTIIIRSVPWFKGSYIKFQFKHFSFFAKTWPVSKQTEQFYIFDVTNEHLFSVCIKAKMTHPSYKKLGFSSVLTHVSTQKYTYHFLRKAGVYARRVSMYRPRNILPIS